MKNGFEDKNKILSRIERSSVKATVWIGSTQSIIVHTFAFGGLLALVFLGVPLDLVLLVLTTLVSLEAIYLAIFIQMSINRNTAQLQEVEKDIEEISEEVEEISEDIDEIQEDVGEIQEDVEEISEDVEDISEDVEEIQEDIDEDKTEEERLTTIENKLADLLKEIQALKK